ncbi:PREDICTED: uncharacterized protein LOC106105139 [Papilio polytes]|uniref:uncharacterized protein LOC106105139 n=1 Tax=Papilio polytes TaxID=76194 RepID=UPI000675C580|nr:PREDICTED: uncharacterized protein LOC106105139 [Papilio polytes]
MRERTVKVNTELNIENDTLKKIQNISQPSVINKELKQENLSNEKLKDISDVSKSVKETVNLYEFVDTKPEMNKEIKPEENDRKLFLLQELEESIEDDTNEMVATECIAGKYFKYSNNQRDLNEKYTKTEDYQSKEFLIDEDGQRIDYVATVTVEHKQTPTPIIIEKSNKSLEINRLAINESIVTSEIHETEVEEISDKVEDRIKVNETKHLNEVIIPTPIVEEMDTITVHEATNQINESFNEVQKDSVEITELNEELPIVNIESKNLSVVQVRGVETIEEVKTHLHETEENEISYDSNASAILAEEIAITTTETKEFENAQIVAIATARQTSEVYNEVEGAVEITEITEESPIVKIEEENLTKPVIYGKDVSRQISAVYNTIDDIKKEDFLEDRAVEVLEIKELTTALKLNYGNIEEINTSFNQLDIESFCIEKNEELATSSTEVQELIKIKSICIATAFDFDTKLEESEHFEQEIKESEQCSSLEVMDEIVKLYSICYAVIQDIIINTEEVIELSILKIEQEVADSNLESKFHTAKGYCVSVVNNITVDLQEVNNFETSTIIEEKSTEHIEIEVFSKAHTLNTEICQKINISLEEVKFISIDESLNEIANVKEEDKRFITILPIAIPCLTHLDTILIEADASENECITEEHPSYEEEKRYIYSTQGICIPICNNIETHLEECNTFEGNEIPEELALTSIEENVFANALSICTSISNETYTIYVEAEVIVKEFKEEKAEWSEEENHFSKALVTCNEISGNIKVLLEVTNELIIDQFKEEFSTTQIEPQTFITALAIITSVSSEIITNYFEAELLPEEQFPKENAILSEEENKYFNALTICYEINQDIELLLEVINELVINKLEEETASPQLELQRFLTALSICTSILNNIDIIYSEADILSVEKLQEDIVETSLEDNYYFKALKTSVDISQYIKLLLEESTSFLTEELEEVLPSTSIEPFVLEKSLPLSTSILNDVNEELFETNNLLIEDIKGVEANVFVEVSQLILILAICVAAIEEIYKDLEECDTFKVNEIEEEFCSVKEEPLLIRIFPICISILEHINTSYNSTEVLEIKQMLTENADTNEVTSFNVDTVSEYQAEYALEPKLFPKTLPICTATVFISNVPVFEIINLETEIFEQKTVSESLETKELATAQKICHAVIKQDDESLKKVQNTSISYEMKEDNANLSYEDIQLIATYAVSSATAKEVDLKYAIAENYESNLELEQIGHSTIEGQDFTKAQSINNATATNESINLQDTEYKESNFVEESAIIKIEPKHKNIVSIKEMNVSYENGDNKITKASKKKNVKAISTTKDETVTLSVKKSMIEENFGNLESLQIEDLNENERIITEETVQLNAKETVTKGRKKLIKQKSSKAQESNIQSNIGIQEVSKTNKYVTDVKSKPVKEPIIENISETSVNIQEYKENSEANVNITINKTKAKRDETSEEMSYNLTLAKPQVIETIAVSNEDTLHVKRKKNLKQYHTEEFQEEFNLNLDQDNESGLTIQEITDSDENIEDVINIENRNDSIDASLEYILQSQNQNTSKDVFEAATIVKQRNKEHASNQEESADLTIFKKDVLTAVIENYDELNSKQVNTYLSTKDVDKTEIIYSQSTDFKSENTKNTNQKRISQKSRSNVQSINTELKKETHKVSIGNGISDLEINAKSQISAIEGSFEKAKTSSQESRTLVSHEINSAIVNNKTKSLSVKTNLKREEIDASQTIKTNESSPEIDSPTKPPTPLTDEYIFRLTAPLPKSRGTTPAPREPSPEIHKENIVNQNLIPTIESVTIERVIYNPPLPTPPTSPVHSPTYTKPGLNGGMKRLPRYFKPGLRGGSDRPPIPKEEILEVRKHLSTLTSDINETLKNIEKYKKIVETLKQEKAEGESSKTMEEENTEEQTKLEEIDANTKETSEQISIENQINEQPPDIKPTEIQSNSQIKIEINNEKTDTVNIDIKHDFTNKIEEARIRGYDIKEITSFEELEKENENTGVVELPPDTGEESIKREFNTIEEDSEPEKPENVVIKIDKDVEESGIVDVPTDEEQKTADEEVARVTALTIDRSTSKETSPSGTDTVKEAHVISLTRVLSSHMLREGLSPDCQKMKDKFENKKDVLEDNINEDRSWTTFLQKSTNVPTQTLRYFADLQNKFEYQEPFATKLINRNEVRSPVIKPRDFNSSPIPWQERKLADTLGAPNITELTPGDEPKFFLAIPTESKENSVHKSTVIPVNNPNEEISNIEKKGLNAESEGEHTVEEIIQEALMRVECLNIGDGKNRLIQLLLNNIKNIAADASIPVEEQIYQMRMQLETLEQVPDIIQETFENVAEKLYQKNQKKEETLHSKGVKYQELGKYINGDIFS